MIGLIKDELDGEIMKEFVVLRAKKYGHLKDNNEIKKIIKKQNGQKSLS